MPSTSADSDTKPKRPPPNATFREQFVCCRRRWCSLCHGTEYLHGPYVYAFVKNSDGGVWTWYVGRPARKPAKAAERPVAVAAKGRRKRSSRA